MHKVRIVIGAIFCQVEISMHCVHEILAMTLGSHQCVGAAPNFSIRLNTNKIIIKEDSSLVLNMVFMVEAVSSISTLPTV